MTVMQVPAPTVNEKVTELIPIRKRVRVFFGGEFIADSQETLLLRHKGYPTAYYFPPEDVRQEFLQETGEEEEVPGAGAAVMLTVQVQDRSAENAAWRISSEGPGIPELAGYFAFKWGQMDRWLEEDEEVYVHPRDPYTRIDVLQSSRHVRVEVNGQTVADSQRPMILYETGVRPRYYLPLTDVRLDLLVDSDHHTQCPYKGTASYYSVQVGEVQRENIIWYYPFPHPEVGKIQNLLAFYDEKVDFYVDGEKLED